MNGFAFKSLLEVLWFSMVMTKVQSHLFGVLVWLMSPNLEEADKTSKVSHKNETQSFYSNRKKTLLLVLFVRVSSC